MTIEDALQGVTSILVDTSPLIYHLEHHPHRAPIMARFFQIRAEMAITLVTSPVTLAECLVHPVRLGLADLASAYHRLIVNGENTEFRPVGSAEARLATRIRADHDLRLADAFQVAVALEAGCEAILTNDMAFKRVAEIPAIVLDELEL